MCISGICSAVLQTVHYLEIKVAILDNPSLHLFHLGCVVKHGIGAFFAALLGAVFIILNFIVVFPLEVVTILHYNVL